MAIWSAKSSDSRCRLRSRKACTMGSTVRRSRSTASASRAAAVRPLPSPSGSAVEAGDDLVEMRLDLAGVRTCSAISPASDMTAWMTVDSLLTTSSIGPSQRDDRLGGELPGARLGEHAELRLEPTRSACSRTSRPAYAW